MVQRPACSLFLAVGLLIFNGSAYAQNPPQCVADVQAKLSAALDKKPVDLSGVRGDAMMCLTRNRGNAAAMRMRARVELEMGEYVFAAEWYGKAIAADPANADGYAGRGSAYIGQYRDSTYQRKDLRDLGMADLDKALEIDPRHAGAILERISVRQDAMGTGYLVLMPEYDKAIEILRTSNDLRALSKALAARGGAYSLSGTYNKAFDDFTEAIKLDPTNYSLFERRAGVHAGMRNSLAQLQDLSTVINSPEPTASAYSQRGLIYEFAGEITKALADYRVALKLDPSNGAMKEAIPRLEARLQPAKPAASPQGDAAKQAEAHGIKGRQHAEKGEFEAAIRELNECIRLKSDLAPCYMFLGGVYAQQRNEASAFANLNKAVELAPEQPMVYWVRGLMNAQFGKKNEAISDFRTILKFDPSNAQAKAALQQLGVQP